MTEEIKKQLENAKLYVKQGGCRCIHCEECAAEGNNRCNNYETGFYQWNNKSSETQIQLFRDFIAKHEPKKAPRRKPTQNRRHANRNELAWKKVDEVRYFVDAVQFSVIRSTGDGFFTRDDNGGRYSKSSIEGFAKVVPEIFEVTAADLPYLEKPEGDWEFRKVEVSDEFLANEKYEQVRVYTERNMNNDKLSGHRWCAPRKQTCPHCNGTGEI